MKARHSIEDQGLEETAKNVRKELDELIRISKANGWPDHLENAVSNIEAALDDIHRRRSQLDEGMAA
jgi:hypothetical protein